MTERKRGQKICSECGCVNGVRAYECKQCDYPFKMKKYRKGNKKKKVEDHKTLIKGDVIRVVGGSGPYHTDYNGEKTYLIDRGKYVVDHTDQQGIGAYGKTGFNYLYMGKSCPSPLMDTITKAPCKIILLKGAAHPNYGSPKRRRSRA
tara:strand:+ start:768 stop:1211 length:444 start_codon:yes stop_codon:yes gene_type:complete